MREETEEPGENPRRQVEINGNSARTQWFGHPSSYQPRPTVLNCDEQIFSPVNASDNTSKLKLTWLTKGFTIAGKFWNENTVS